MPSPPNTPHRRRDRLRHGGPRRPHRSSGGRRDRGRRRHADGFGPSWMAAYRGRRATPNGRVRRGSWVGGYRVPLTWTRVPDHGRESRRVTSDAGGHARERRWDDGLEAADHGRSAWLPDSGGRRCARGARVRGWTRGGADFTTSRCANAATSRPARSKRPWCCGPAPTRASRRRSATRRRRSTPSGPMRSEKLHLSVPRASR